MKFYLWERTTYHRRRKKVRTYRRAHILQEENRAKPVCNVPLDLEKWIIVEQLPEATHLCGRCKRLARQRQ